MASKWVLNISIYKQQQKKKKGKKQQTKPNKPFNPIKMLKKKIFFKEFVLMKKK